LSQNFALSSPAGFLPPAQSRRIRPSLFRTARTVLERKGSLRRAKKPGAPLRSALGSGTEKPATGGSGGILRRAGTNLLDLGTDSARG